MISNAECQSALGNRAKASGEGQGAKRAPGGADRLLGPLVCEEGMIEETMMEIKYRSNVYLLYLVDYYAVRSGSQPA